jgi:prepilin-type N-terminal cleavage/methylation domain-containing protein
MRFNLFKTAGQRTLKAFTLAEVMVSSAIFALVAAGAVYGYVQADRAAEWSSMSLAAQSLASEGLERARAAVWQTQSGSGTTADDLPASTNIYWQTNGIEAPGSGKIITNFVSISVSSVSTNPPVRQIVSSCGWQYPFTGKWFTNTLITQRASN